MVRTRWSSLISQIPDQHTDWISFGVINITKDIGTTIERQGVYDVVTNHYAIQCECSVYGPSYIDNTFIIQDNIAHPSFFTDYTFAFIDCHNAGITNELFNNDWYLRADLSMRFRYSSSQNVFVDNFSSASISLLNCRGNN